MHTQSLLVSLFASMALAHPHSSSSKPKSHAISSLTIPTTAGLPSQPSNLTLVHVAVGLGTQNYTCTASSNGTFTATSIGAVAKLHKLDKVLTSPETNYNEIIGQIACAADALNTGLGFPTFGHHYFTAAGVPTFDLTGTKQMLAAKKMASANALTTFCTGRNGAGPVDWLFLEDNGSGVSRGLKAVYRAETAGGSALVEQCKKAGDVIVSDYAAMYWFLE